MRMREIMAPVGPAVQAYALPAQMQHLPDVYNNDNNTTYYYGNGGYGAGY